MKTRLKHVRANVNVKDLKKAAEWYKNVLGYNVAATWPPKKPNYVHFEHGGRSMFGLLEHKNSPTTEGLIFM